MEPTLMDIKIDVLARDVKKGSTVLFLGPELLADRNGHYYKTVFSSFARESNGRFRYFSHDNLFSIHGEIKNKDRYDLATMVTDYYQQAGDETLLSLIAQLPFSLIINLAPDTSVNKVFKANGFDFFATYGGAENKTQVPAPDSSLPVVYNVFGSIESRQSLILTHADLYKSIADLQKNNIIPLPVARHLKNADSFIFLGVGFDSWYFRLLLNVLEIDQSHSLRISHPAVLEEDTVGIMNAHFQFTFADKNPMALIQSLHDHISTTSPDSVRKTRMKELPTAAYISYASGRSETDISEVFVNQLVKSLQEKGGASIYRDREVLKLQDSIESFMNRIGRGKAVIMVVSDKFLRSEYCMYEAWEVYKNRNFNERVFLTVLPDVVLDDDGVLDYINYWLDRKNILEGAIMDKMERNFPALDKLIGASKNIYYIYLFINEFLNIIKDTIHYAVTQQMDESALEKDPGFNQFINQIINRLKE